VAALWLRECASERKVAPPTLPDHTIERRTATPLLQECVSERRVPTPLLWEHVSERKGPVPLRSARVSERNMLTPLLKELVRERKVAALFLPSRVNERRSLMTERRLRTNERWLLALCVRSARASVGERQVWAPEPKALASEPRSQQASELHSRATELHSRASELHLGKRNANPQTVALSPGRSGSARPLSSRRDAPNRALSSARLATWKGSNATMAAGTPRCSASWDTGWRRPRGPALFSCPQFAARRERSAVPLVCAARARHPYTTMVGHSVLSGRADGVVAPKGRTRFDTKT
jgi:hypothetical protein